MKSKKIANKQNNMNWLIPLLSLLAFLIAIIYIYLQNKPVKNNFSSPILLGSESEVLDVEDDYIFKSYQDFKEKTNSNILKAVDFKNNNYVLVRLIWDGCSEDEIEILGYEIKGNNLTFKYTYEAGCGFCAPINDYYLVPIDKNITKINVDIDGKARNNPHCDPYVDYKPLIYLYPEKEINVTVKLGYPEKLTTTYPKYDNGWNVKAYPNGDLKDQDNKYYYGLYWEGLNNLTPTFEDGFFVERTNIISFLEEKLTILGLNDREKNEFIIYWLPKLEENKYNLIRFETIDNINKEMPLLVTPKPDSTIRVLMEFKSVDKMISIKEQKLTTPTRSGFTVVEWGGTIIK